MMQPKRGFEMDVIVEDTIVEKFGLVLRIVRYDDKEFPYVVEQTPLIQDGTYDKEDFSIFGGSVGCDSSEFETDEKAKEFYNDVRNLDSKQILKKYPNLWVE